MEFSYNSIKVTFIFEQSLRQKNLIEDKPIKFFKNKLIEWQKAYDKIDEEILSCYKQLEEELDLVEKMELSINRKENKEKENLVKNGTISFYDLLSLIKNDIIPKKILLRLNKQEKEYIFDGKSKYILENEKEKNNIFKIHLSDSISDIEKIQKNLVILE